MAELSIVEASIEELQAALSSGALTSVELVARYLRRIGSYDCSGPTLNAIPIINPDVFAEAATSDEHRAARKPVRPLEGIPYTVKDSYKTKGMTIASGSPAFKDLVANEDAFTVAAIRAAGGVLIGRTNMPSMAYGGMQRGVYGRAESPYNPKYLAAAFASGSSNGSAVSTAASFAAFGMAEETVSSGRSPASNNALVAYTPSRGWLSIRGNWPLYPTCDVVVPHTRTVKDMLSLLEVISAEDSVTEGDFWRDQPWVKLEKAWPKGPDTFSNIRTAPKSLKNIRIAVPEMYIGGPAVEGARPVVTSEAVVKLWKQARVDLEALGAEVVIVPDFPAVTGYENPALLKDADPRLPENWHSRERGPLVAHGWNQFLKLNKDPNIPDLTSVDGLSIYPDWLRTSAELKFNDKKNMIHWAQLTSYIQECDFYEVEKLEDAVKALEAMRKRLLDDYLSAFGCDCVAFPAAGDVGAADADENDASSEHAWKNGVWYSTGNRALRHLGIPSVTVPMGIVEDKAMPVGLTFAGRSGEDESLLKWAQAYEHKSQLRIAPPATPALASDRIQLVDSPNPQQTAPRPSIEVSKCSIDDKTTADGQEMYKVSIEGSISVSQATQPTGTQESLVPEIDISINAIDVPSDKVELKRSTETSGKLCYTFKAQSVEIKIRRNSSSIKAHAPVAADNLMVVILARSLAGGPPSGCLSMIDTAT
ncbi:hypothetical protein JX266_003160 [Neoarthrinium moseri]|nr:hypothetical protein JX266_003160 [Neoarthrinium moseri]